MALRKRHDVSVVVGGVHLEGWNSYDIKTDMLEIADSFSMSIPFSFLRYQQLVPDSSVKVYIDDTRVLDGFIDDREKVSDRSGSVIEIAGRDKGGRLVDESMPLLKFKGKKIKELAEIVVDQWFDTVTLSNVRNRNLIRGRGRKARPAQPGSIAFISPDGTVITESTPDVPAKQAAAGTDGIFRSRDTEKKVNPGEFRWDVLRHYLKEAGLLAWSSADGDELVIGLPDYDQDRQYYFFNAELGSDRYQDVNVNSMKIRDSTAERYSSLTVCGSGRGTSANYGRNVLKRRHTVKNNPLTPGGDGLDFSAPKRLLVADGDVKNMKTARERAEQKMAERDAAGLEVTITVPYHGQSLDKGEPTLYAFDTVAMVEDEEIVFEQEMLITAARYFGNRQSGEGTELNLIPQGTLLRI